MKTKDIYKENKNRKYCPIIEIKSEDIGIESSPIKVIKKHLPKFLIGTIIVILILVATFYKDLTVLASVLAFLAFIVGACIISSTYSMKCKEKTLSMKLNFQKFEVSYSRIANIYISKEFTINDLIPMFTYSLVIRYVDNMNFLKELSFPTLFLKPDDIEKFLENFIIQKEQSKECIKYEKYKMVKRICKATGFVLFIIVIVLVVIFSLK
ncbi:MAG: hypothetical protein J6D03_09410 [Clostridia bacterium]|nr:hypothetical protein [Clostridia bacterium]